MLIFEVIFRTFPGFIYGGPRPAKLLDLMLQESIDVQERSTVCDKELYISDDFSIQNHQNSYVFNMRASAKKIETSKRRKFVGSENAESGEK